MSIQTNTMSSKGTWAGKTKQIISLVDRYNIDGITIREHGINHSNMLPLATLASFFDTSVEFRLVSGYNRHENPPSNHLPGGMAILMTNMLLPCVTKTGTDHRGLGQWSWMTLSISREHRT